MYLTFNYLTILGAPWPVIGGAVGGVMAVLIILILVVISLCVVRMKKKRSGILHNCNSCYPNNTDFLSWFQKSMILTHWKMKLIGMQIVFRTVRNV